MAITVTSITPTIVPTNGGHQIDIKGTFQVDEEYIVYIGPSKTTGDAQAYSGVAGQGNIIKPRNATTLRVFTPVLPEGGPFAVLVISQDSADQADLAAVMNVIQPDFALKVFDLRRVLPPWYHTGPRGMEFLEPL